ncbi:MAG TPA: ATP-binding protein [Rhodanobacteraceae bacterium]|nr:ATP-binding protein [Rhodanobacteraceae bacterium]
MGDASAFTASSPSDLDRLQAFVARACDHADVDADTRFAVRLAVEESFTNIMQYGYGPGGGPVTIAVQFDERRIIIVIRDRGPPFDPTDVPAPVLDTDWQHREAGGLGVHLVRHMMDDVAYVRDLAGENVLTLIKNRSGAAMPPQGGRTA